MRVMKNRDIVEIKTSIQEKFALMEQHDLAERAFWRNLSHVLSGVKSAIPSTAIRPVAGLAEMKELGQYAEFGLNVLPKLMICKLNGGLGTSMGLEAAKSLLPVRDGLSFLDLTVRQIKAIQDATGIAIPFFCMNSFRTEIDTLQILERSFPSSHIPLSLLQNQVPKLVKETLLPVHYPADPSLEWCPPGHGDLYTVLQSSGLLAQAVASGYRYLFVSNADNLGATMSVEILGYMAHHGIPFVMEVAERTEIDRKGGHLALTSEGRLTLREKAQVAHVDEEDFQDFKKYDAFNTNSIWIDLHILQELLNEHDAILPLPVITNEKRVNPRDTESTEVMQLETAVGSAISLFEGATAVRVPRSRFLPVKTTEDLLRVRSDLFSLNEQWELCGDEESLAFPIKLDSRYFGHIDQFEERFAHGVPSLKGAKSFQVVGDVFFGGHVVCEGNAIVTNDVEAPANIEDGTRL
jgi:UTP--glucose-1-phosphate uridylyltransferase